MKYEKNALSFEEQADLLISRELIISDKASLVNILSNVNYYRLSGYWYPFLERNKKTNKENFIEGTTIEQILDRYFFDKKLKFIVMQALEIIEVSVLRTRMVEAFTLNYGRDGYLEKSNYNPKFSYKEFCYLLNIIVSAINKSKKRCIHILNNFQ